MGSSGRPIRKQQWENSIWQACCSHPAIRSIWNIGFPTAQINPIGHIIELTESACATTNAMAATWPPWPGPTAIPPSGRPCIRPWNLSDTGGSVIRHVLCTITDHISQKYPNPIVSPCLDWLAWLGLLTLLQRGSSRLQQPQLQSKHPQP